MVSATGELLTCDSSACYLVVQEVVPSTNVGLVFILLPQIIVLVVAVERIFISL
jgi:hypothetical protein